MKFQIKSDRTLGEGDRCNQYLENSTFFNSTLQDIAKPNCCWNGCPNCAVYFDSWNWGYCMAHLPKEAEQC